MSQALKAPPIMQDAQNALHDFNDVPCRFSSLTNCLASTEMPGWSFSLSSGDEEQNCPHNRQNHDVTRNVKLH